MRLYGYLWIARELDEIEVSQVCGWYVHGKKQGDRLGVEECVVPVDERQINLMSVPDQTIVKMSKKQHVDSFMKTGELQLGTYDYYNKIGHNEIGDDQEGQTVLLGQRQGFTAAGKFAGGFDSYIFCTYLGTPDANVLDRFGYDSGFIIKDPKKFTHAIQEIIGAQNFSFGCCAYSEHKALRGRLSPDHSFERLDHRTMEMVGEARHFLKPDSYSHQREFRFTWRITEDVAQPLLVRCPEAVQFCEPLR